MGKASFRVAVDVAIVGVLIGLVSAGGMMQLALRAATRAARAARAPSRAAGAPAQREIAGAGKPRLRISAPMSGSLPRNAR
jgi:hypothetical protein